MSDLLRDMEGVEKEIQEALRHIEPENRTEALLKLLFMLQMSHTPILMGILENLEKIRFQQK